MKRMTARLFSMAVGLNAVSAAVKANASKEQETDVLLIGGGIMSATLGTYLQELEPNGRSPWWNGWTRWRKRAPTAGIMPVRGTPP